MNDRTKGWPALKRLNRTLLIGLIAAGLFGCQNESEDEAAMSMLGPLADQTKLAIAGYFYFEGNVDLERTTSCGTAAVPSSSTTTTDTGSTSSSSSSSSSSSETSDPTKFNIDSFWYFQSGTGSYKWNSGTMVLRFLFNENKESFTLNPVTSNASTCFTADGINCNGSSDNGNPECTTLDNVKCGGEQTFIYTNEDPEFSFQANSGTIDYQRGFNLDDNNEAVALAKIDFSMLATDGTIFQGKANCRSQEQ